MKVTQLRQKHPVFYYHSFETKLAKDNLHLCFVFQTKPDIFFRPKVVIENVKQSQINKLGGTFDNLVFHLGLAEIPSYWKATCSPQIIIKASYLNQEQIKFWQKLLIKGLGQFFYENKVNFTKEDFVEIKTYSKKQDSLPAEGSGAEHGRIGRVEQPDPKAGTRCPRYLIPLGGGKDSIVTLEILKKAGLETNLFILNPTKTTFKISKLAGYKNPIIIRRKIDPQLLKLNDKGYLNGHVPITAYISFLSLLLAALNNYNNIVFSNERSADEENLIWKGEKINHQYSKSFQFENDFRNYSQKYLTENINYFSFLRPLYELQISKQFSHYPKYFEIFRSCNVGQKTNSWCCSCPKCLSVYLHLSAFLPRERLIEIFGVDLLSKKKLLSLFRKLLGIKGSKPFECVGTIEENQAAAYLIIQKAKSLPFLLQAAQKYLKKINYNRAKANKILNSWSDNHNLPENLKKILRKNAQKS